MLQGILNVYKEAGFTSHDVVAKLRGILGQKKIGHTGTLDPQAVGVLPVCLGNATKVCDLIAGWEKEYEAVMLLGVETDTQDTTGTILSRGEVDVSEERAAEVLRGFVGAYDQIPPMYSALKVNGKKLYELARAGREVERQARRVTIYGLEILSVQLPRIRMRVRCSKGTYIRTFCHDAGRRLGCGAAMEQLTRTALGPFTGGEALTLSEIEELRDKGKLGERILPVDELFPGESKIRVGGEYRRLVENGNRILIGQIVENGCFTDGEQVRVYDEEGRFYGIYEYNGEGSAFTPVKMFL